MNRMEAEAQARKKLEEWLADNHPADHPFLPSIKDPSVCGTCGWLGPNGEPLPCGHTLREHALDLLNQVREGKTTVLDPEPMLVLAIRYVPSRPWWKRLFDM